MAVELHPGKRICQVVKLKPEFYDEYVKVHDAVWPSVLELLSKYHIEDYSIFYLEQYNLLIATMKYLGDDYEADCAKMVEEDANLKWWKMTDEMQESLVAGSLGSVDNKGWWLNVPEVFRHDH
ncbi:BA75_03697T0 [Komagataella pastoris]|uniref:BA75_03697T0 n=1 Tax=Komagataella pastoris TaxID=4922 RepID=A0A1B2JGC8_PICPA|nr:BA75_03697T0 [Komagataella pastoris]